MNCLCNLFDDCEVWLWIAIIILIFHALCCDNGCSNVGGSNCGCNHNCGCGDYNSGSNSCGCGC